MRRSLANPFNGTAVSQTAAVWPVEPMMRALLLASLLSLTAVAMVPAAAADHFSCTVNSPTVCLVAGAGNYAIHTPDCLLNTPPVAWVACITPGTGFPGQVVGYVLCYGNTGP